LLNRLLDPLLSLGGWQAYALVGGLCFGEAAVLLGFVLPGETAVVLGGVLAYEGHVSLLWMTLLVVGCAVVGDSVGYGMGRLLGPRLLRLRLLRRPVVAKAQSFVRRRGRVAVFLGRFTAVFRTLVPGVAGMSGLRYRRFLQANVPAGVLWGIAYTMAGWAVGLSYREVLRTASAVSYSIVGLVLCLVVGWHVLRRRRDRGASPAEGRPRSSGPRLQLRWPPGRPKPKPD
jgi:membrane protein DedA with SNARE-associated domain